MGLRAGVVLAGLLGLLPLGGVAVRLIAVVLLVSLIVGLLVVEKRSPRAAR